MLTWVYFIIGILLIVISLALTPFSQSMIQMAHHRAECQRVFKQLKVTYLVIGAIGVLFGILTLCGLLLSKGIVIAYVVVILIASAVFGIRLMKQL